MKIRCTECGKRYDDDLYSGVCPKCGNYVGSGEEQYDAPSDYQPVSGVEETSYTTFDEDTYVPPASRNPGKKLAKRIYTAVILFLIIVVGAGSYGIIWFTRDSRQEERQMDDLREPRVISKGEPFTYETENNLYNIVIDSVTVDDDPALNVPEEYEMLVVSYNIERIYTGTGAGDFDAYYEICMIPYVETKSGSYLESVRDYDLREALGITDSMELDKMGISDDFSLKEGKLYYLVKKGDFKSLYITSFDYDFYDYEQGALREIFRIEGLEVQR